VGCWCQKTNSPLHSRFGRSCSCRSCDWFYARYTAYAQFDWYEHVYYWDPAVKFPDDRSFFVDGWIGFAEVAIDELAFYILTKTGKVIIRKSVWALREDDRHDPGIFHQMADLDA
jgi:hypothetical protein